MEQLSRGTTRRTTKTLVFVESLSLRHNRASACVVFVNINVAMAAREAFVLLEAVVVMFVTTTTRDNAAAAAATMTTTSSSSSSASPHALKSVAIPSFTTTSRRLFEAVQVAGRGAIDRHG